MYTKTEFPTFNNCSLKKNLKICSKNRFLDRSQPLNLAQY